MEATLTLTPSDCDRELAKRFQLSEFFDFAPEWSALQRKPLTSEREFIFVIGGNGSGKTTIGSWATACRIIGFNPLIGKFYRTESGRDYRKRTYNIYVVGTTDDDVEQRLKPSVLDWLPFGMDIQIDNKHNTWTIDGVVKVFWKSVAQKARAFQGDEVDFCWIDEDPEKRDVWSEILARTFRRLGQVMVTMTAWQGVLWLHQFIFHPDEYPQESKLVVKIPVPNNPYYWLCNCGHSKRMHLGGHDCTKPGCDCKQYNCSIGQRKLRRMKARYKGLEYRIRVLGDYELMAGKSVVAPSVIDEHLKRSEEHPRPAYGFINSRTQFVNVGDAEDPRSVFRICVPPKHGHTYLIGADASEGNPTGDYHAAVVFDQETAQQVAVCHTRNCDPKDYGTLLVQLARFYNDAFVVLEINNHGLAVFDKMVELHYGNLYMRQILDSRDTRLQKKKGFWTDKKSKPLACDLMVDLVNHTWDLRDPIIMHELYGFLYLKENREGKHGIGNGNPDGHDDLCMALLMAAIGWQAMGLLCAAPDEDPLPPPPPRQHRMIELIEQDAFGPRIEEEHEEESLLDEASARFQEQLFEDMGAEEVYWADDNGDL